MRNPHRSRVRNEAWFTKMKVCHLYLDALSPEEGGGVATVLYGIIANTYKKIDYQLITPFKGEHASEDLRIASTLYERKAEIHVIRSRNLILDLIALARIHRMLGRCDIVQFNDFYYVGDMVRCSLLIQLLRALSPVKLLFGFYTTPRAIQEYLGGALHRGLYRFLFQRLLIPPTPLQSPKLIFSYLYYFFIRPLLKPYFFGNALHCQKANFNEFFYWNIQALGRGAKRHLFPSGASGKLWVF